jgi:hypothetical protein
MKSLLSLLRSATPVLVLCVATSAATPAHAHHSYAMFDGAQTRTVAGTIAKLEWSNPHVFVWVYVPNAARTGHDLYAFENGSTNVLARRGWSKTTLAPGELVTVEYWPLKDGRNGGHFRLARHADGRITRGVGGPRGADGALDPPASAAAAR